MEKAKLILEYIKVLIWPLLLLVVLIGFRKPIADVFQRTKKLELPGGISIEVFEENIQEARELALEIENEVREIPDDQNKEIEPLTTESEVNQRMIELGLKPSPSGLQISYYQDLAESDPRFAMASLRMDLELMLKNLAIGFGIDISDEDSNSKISSKLLDKGAISNKQFQLINKLIQIANAAIHGIEVTESQAIEVANIMSILIREYKSWLSWGFES